MHTLKKAARCRTFTLALTSCSITLFPSIRTATGASTGTDISATPACASATSPRPGNPASIRTSPAAQSATASPAPDTPTQGRSKRAAKAARQAAADADTIPAVPALDWSNTCTFNMSQDRKLVVKQCPDWHVLCTAAHHAAHIAVGVVTCSDFDARVRMPAMLSRSACAALQHQHIAPCI